jgi:hypothetical protein
MNFVFDDDDKAVSRPVGNQLVGGLKRDVVDIASELGHQRSSSLDNAWPTGEVVENFVDEVVCENVEEVLTLYEVA